MKSIARFILKNKAVLTSLIVVLTILLSYFAKDVRPAFQFVKLLPDDDEASIQYEKFKKYFKQDGTILVIGTEFHKLYNPKVFEEWHLLGNKIKNITGIQSVVSIDRLLAIQYDDSLEKFSTQVIPFPENIDSTSVSEYLEEIQEYKFYEDIIFNKKKDIAVMTITFNEKELNSELRLSITDSIVKHARHFEKQTGVELHLSGMPFIRTTMMRKISSETTHFFYCRTDSSVCIALVFLSFAIGDFIFCIGRGIWCCFCIGIDGINGVSIVYFIGIIACIVDYYWCSKLYFNY
ncbi:MAG: hypothetical protein KatS3mg027_2126 [Bacteroidia bacterium]|nr:MAG: hypothetical protein KatS3mg027_2126 [Bacteroidia bacterium]